MADNTAQNGTDTLATDDLGGGVKVQRVKVGFGVDGAYADATGTVGLPIAAISMPAAADTTDAVASAIQVGKVKSGLVDIAPIRISTLVAASSSHTVLHALVAAKALLVLAFHIVCGATPSTVVFETSTANAAISAVYTFGANGGVPGSFNPLGWFATNVGDALQVTTGAGSATVITMTCVAV